MIKNYVHLITVVCSQMISWKSKLLQSHEMSSQVVCRFFKETVLTKAMKSMMHTLVDGNVSGPFGSIPGHSFSNSVASCDLFGFLDMLRCQPERMQRR